MQPLIDCREALIYTAYGTGSKAESSV